MRQVLVTGAGSGIGREIARTFARNGDRVTIAGRREAPLRETDAESGMELRLADVTNEDQVKALFSTPFDVVVANAGGAKAGKVVDMSLDAWNDTINLNLTGVFLTFREALKKMKAGGRLIAISSLAGLKGAPNIAAYGAAKHGVIGLVRSLAREVAKDGITCNAVCPGYVDTPLARTGVSGLVERFGITEAEAIARMVAGNPIGRMITCEEVAASVMYLASAEAAMVNGHTLNLTGGEI